MFSIFNLQPITNTALIKGKINNNIESRISKIFFGSHLQIIFLLLALASSTVIQATNPDEFISQTTSSNTPETSTETKITPALRNFSNISTSTKITELMNEMKNLSKQIVQMKSSPGVNNNDKKRLTVIDNTIQLLRSSLPNPNDENVTKIAEKLEEFMQETSNLMNKFKPELNLIRERTEIVLEVARRRLPEECVKDIEAERLMDAIEKLTRLNDTEISDIIRKVSNHFDTMLEISDFITEMPKKFTIYDSLNFMENIRGYNNPFRLTKLSQRLKKQIIDRSSDLNYKTQAENILNNLIPHIETLSKRSLKEAILSNRHDLTDQLMNEVVSLDYVLFKQIISYVVHDTAVLEKIGKKQLISYMYDFKNLKQSISGLSEIYDTLTRNDSAILPLALTLKTLMSDTEYPNLPSFIKNEYQMLKNKIPPTQRLIAFSSPVCIKNVYHNEYLHTSNSLTNRSNGENYHVVTSISKDKSYAYKSHMDKFKWIFQNTRDNIFFIKNVFHSQYFLYASNIEKFPKRRQVFVSQNFDDENTEYAANWELIMKTEETFLLKNVPYDENLLADQDRILEYDNALRYVFTLMLKVETYDDKWKIEDCS